jgi:hypothetical protein
MKRSHGLFGSMAAVLLICACGADPGENTSEVLNDREAVQVSDPELTSESVADDREGESSPVDPDLATGFAISSCFGGCLLVSTQDMTGVCCFCNGSFRTLHRSAWNYNTFICR